MMTDSAPGRTQRVWRGLPVPYVTKWSAESIQDQLSLKIDHRTGAVSYADEAITDRDSHGILWYRDGLAPGAGEPLFSQVHVGRQRRCMRLLACQVCGLKITDRPVTWLFPANEWQALLAAANPYTTTPPTCRTCWPVAERGCPALRRGGFVRAAAAEVTAWGVAGDAYSPHSDQVQDRVVVPFTHSLARNIIAKQAAVTVRGLEVAQ